ncbi:MAG: hypothetical protein ACSHYF_16175 [Verrucomicrobiaceae bacterium]
MTKIEGTEKVLVSGTNAIVTLSDGQELTKATVRKAFGEAGLKLEDLDKNEYDKPQAGMRFVGKGGG